MSREWEHHCWRPDPAEIIELTEFQGRPKALRLLDTPAQRAHRLSTVEASIEDDETLLEWHRRVRNA